VRLLGHAKDSWGMHFLALATTLGLSAPVVELFSA
jgi:hypothetical protein